MLECGLQQAEMARAITELQYAAALSGYRQPHAPSALNCNCKHLLSRQSYMKERKDMITKVWEQVKWDSGL